MKRYPFLDWMRGLAVVIMIECHVFNAFTRNDLRQQNGYILSQFVGGMAAVLFLFMAGMTFGFQMESLDRREARPAQRWLGALRRARYVLVIAFIFRFTNWASGFPRSGWGIFDRWQEVLKVDILNCMGVAMAALAVAAVVSGRARVQVAIGAGLAAALAAPLVHAWGAPGLPWWLHNYLVPDTSRFPFFPWTAYLAFGLAAGIGVKRCAADRMDRLMQWAVLLGFGLIYTTQFFDNTPLRLYSHAEFWVDSPSLVFIRTGIILLALAGSYVWTAYCVGEGWSWMQTMGKASLLVYWVHVVLVYGDLIRGWKHNLEIWQAGLITVLLTALMVALAAARLWWKEQPAGRLREWAPVRRRPA